MNRIWRILATTIVASVLGMILTAGAASAGDSDSQYLPVNRWSGATGEMHSRLSENPFEDIAAKIQRNGTYPVLMSLGNSMWSGGTGMTSAAIRMDVLGAAGQTADNAAATIGSSLMSSGILALVALVALVVPLWKSARGQGAAPWGGLAKTAATIGLFATMVVGAGASTTLNPGTPDESFQPGFMSPGWFVVTTNSVLSSLASAPAAALAGGQTGAGFSYDTTAKGALSCFEYTNTMKAKYADTNDITRIEGSIPLVMSGMWEATGLEVWSTSQFGAENPYGDYSYCRLLEQSSGATPATQQLLTRLATENPITDVENIDSLAWQTADNNQTDRTMIAWAQCRPADGGPGWTLAPGWESVAEKDGHTGADGAKADCGKWWADRADWSNEPGAKFQDGTSTFNWDNTKEIIANSGGPDVKNYLLTLQGHTGGATASLAMVYAYVFSSLIMLVVFGLISGAIIVAKISALVMMMATFFVLLVSLWPSAGRSGSVGKFFGQYVGMSLFVFGIQLIFAFLTVITSMLVGAGADMFGPGSFISMIWTGFSPVVAVVVIHMVFKKFLKMPSPFSMSGAQQWGAAASGGAVGGAVGGALGAGVMRRANRMRRRGEYAMMRSGERAANGALGKLSGGRLGRGGAGGRAGSITPGGGTAPAVPTAAGASAGRKLWGAKEAAPAVVTPKQTKEQKAAANAAARERGFRNNAAGQYVEGMSARVSKVKEAFGNRPIGLSAKLAAAKGAARAGVTALADPRHDKSVLKVAGAGALLVATGGLAAPVMAGVWGKNRVGGHMDKVRGAREGAIGSFEAKKAADELAAKKAADLAVARRAGQADAGPNEAGRQAAARRHAQAAQAGPADLKRRRNGETVSTPDRANDWSQAQATIQATLDEPATSTAKSRAQGSRVTGRRASGGKAANVRGGQKPFGGR